MGSQNVVEILEIALSAARHEGAIGDDELKRAKDLLNATEPRDEREERTRCRMVVFGRGPQSLTFQTDEMVRERQNARAESQVELALLRVENARLKRSLELQERETRLAREQFVALRSKSDRLLVGVVALHGRYSDHAGQSKLYDEVKSVQEAAWGK